MLRASTQTPIIKMMALPGRGSGDDVIRYGAHGREGFEDLRDNFYDSLNAGLQMLQFRSSAGIDITSQRLSLPIESEPRQAE